MARVQHFFQMNRRNGELEQTSKKVESRDMTAETLETHIQIDNTRTKTNPTSETCKKNMVQTNNDRDLQQLNKTTLRL